MDARSLVETLKSRGLSLRVDGDRIKVEAPQEPDPETKALVEEMRACKDEVRAILKVPACWNCGAPWSETVDIYGEPVFVCWACAKSA